MIYQKSNSEKDKEISEESKDEPSEVLSITEKELTESNIISVEQLKEDPTKLSIDNGRWTVDIPKRYAICLSEEFEQAALSYTVFNENEWVGFIVGHDLTWTNPENERQIRILIAERIVMISQSRTGASASIDEDEVLKWMDSDDGGEMSFLTVYAVNKWKRIGWVHSHADMGCFWSGTDTNTMKEMRGIPLLLSIVYSRKNKSSVDRLVRVDNNDVFFGGKFNLKRDSIDDIFIYSEAPISSIADVPKDIREKYKKVLKNTAVVEGVQYQQQSKTTTYDYSGYMGGYSPGSGFTKSYHYPYGSYTYDKATGRYIQNTTVSTIKDNRVEIAGTFTKEDQDKVEKFTNFYYSLDSKKRSNLTLVDFFRMFNEEFGVKLAERKKWKLKEIVEILISGDFEELKVIFDFFFSNVYLALAKKSFHNFIEFSEMFLKLMKSKAEKDEKLNSFMETAYEKDWHENILKRLKEKQMINVTIEKNKSETVSKPVESIPKPYVEKEKGLKWKECFGLLPKRSKNRVFEIIYNSAKDENMKIDLFGSLTDGLSYLVDKEEETYVDYVANVYQSLVDEHEKISEELKSLYRNFYTRFFLEAFAPYFKSKYTTVNNKLQLLINAIDEKYVKCFVNDFIFEYDTEEEFEKITTKYQYSYPVSRQKFSCSICKKDWYLREDAEACEESCKSRGCIYDTVDEVEAVGESKKVQTTLTTTKTKTQSIPTKRYATELVDVVLYYNQDISKFKLVEKLDTVFGISYDEFRYVDVCKYCGSIFETTEAKQAHMENCKSFLDKIVTYYMTENGSYMCPYCGMVVKDEEGLEEHEKCLELGVLISYLKEQIDSCAEISGVVSMYTKYFASCGGNLSSFLQWLCDNNTIQKVRTKLISDGINVPDAISNSSLLMIGYGRDKYKSLVKDFLFSMEDDTFVCSLCEKEVMNVYDNASDFATHLFYEHGLFPLVSEIESMRPKKEAVSDVKQEDYLTTENVFCDNHKLFCKYCVFATKDVELMATHVLKQHIKEVKLEEYTEWSSYLEDGLSGVFQKDVDAGDCCGSYSGWFQNKIARGKSPIICEHCMEEFRDYSIRTVYDTIQDRLECFFHELECVYHLDVDMDEYRCAFCGSLHVSVSEREECENRHISSVEEFEFE